MSIWPVFIVLTHTQIGIKNPLYLDKRFKTQMELCFHLGCFWILGFGFGF